jgi:hypothetical protein
MRTEGNGREWKGTEENRRERKGTEGNGRKRKETEGNGREPKGTEGNGTVRDGTELCPGKEDMRQFPLAADTQLPMNGGVNGGMERRPKGSRSGEGERVGGEGEVKMGRGEE